MQKNIKINGVNHILSIGACAFSVQIRRHLGYINLKYFNT